MKLPRRIVTVTAAAAALTATLAAPTPQASAATTYAGYVMGYFTESNQGAGNNYGLHLAVSTDGLEWTPLNQNAPVVTPTAGTLGLRDPFILRKQDGTFQILATDLNGTDWSQQNQYIHVWDSTDLRSFTNYRRVKLHSMATHSWAPEAFWDASRGQYAIIYSADNGTRNVIMVNYTTDFTNVSTAQVYFDPGFNVIDADVAVGDNGTNYLYYKDEASGGKLRGAKATSLAPGSFNSGTYTGTIAHGGTEAPILVKSLTASNTWYLWGDTYTPNGVFYAWQTTSIGIDAWTPVDQKRYTQPLNSKHATITPITATEMSNLLARWGAPTWNRLKSYNYPDRYVRHADYAGRIDPYPFDPYLDSEWKLVPGLADSAGVSFQSVNFPDRYLRQSSYNVVLDPNDGSSTFKSDATFYPTAGLADAAAKSYRSYAHPDRYLRHFAYALRIDPLGAGSPVLDRQDATFLLTR
ncbi:AbfB domain-containing protein [Kitasatospora sp. NPDC048365]|uniref:AbfB domain-containing protein n=1 Tax=Kitasatospora sp. NPDC048365 TaxID=3364050 RepID=UPI00371CB541